MLHETGIDGEGGCSMILGYMGRVVAQLVLQKFFFSNKGDEPSFELSYVHAEVTWRNETDF